MSLFKCGVAVLNGGISDVCKKTELAMSENYVKLLPVGLSRHQNIEVPKLGVRYGVNLLFAAFFKLIRLVKN